MNTNKEWLLKKIEQDIEKCCTQTSGEYRASMIKAIVDGWGDWYDTLVHDIIVDIKKGYEIGLDNEPYPFEESHKAMNKLIKQWKE